MSDDTTRFLPELGKVDVGTQLSGIYELDQHLASGGMGEVYRGHNIQTGDHVAIKIVLPEFARDQMVLSLFRKEASILNHLSHDAIVRYHVFTIDPVIGRPYLAMEFVDGEALIEVMRRGPMPIEQVRRLAARLAAGLQAVHEAHTLHRDLSPDNIILPGGRVERAKIIDFGIARSAVGESTLLGGRFAGKYNYVSPEQLGLHGGEASERSDIYSLGLVLAAALRGKPLDMNGTQLEVIEKRRVVPNLSEIDSSIRPMIEAMLQPDPAHRPASMADVVALASTAPGTVPPRAQTGSPSPAGFVEHRRPAFLDQPVPPLPTRGRGRSRAIPIAAAAAVVLAMIAAGIAYMVWPQETPQPAIVQRPSAPPPVVETAKVEPSSTTVPEPAAPAERVEPTTTAQQPASPAPVAQPEVAVAPPAILPETVPAEQETEQATAEPERPGAASAPAAELPPLASPSEPTPPEIAVEKPVEQAAIDPAAEALDAVAQRISWLHDYPGGSCFYATATDASDSAIAVEGFGTAVEPFAQMLSAFQSRFGVEPDVSVRLIDPSQCAVTAFLRDLPSTSDRPQLTLDRTSVPNGTPVSGGFDKAAGRVSNLLLIDHDGMVFNLDGRMSAQGDRNSFSVPIGLSATDAGRKGGVPQVIIAVTAQQPIKAASFTEPRPATDVLPAILAEIRAQKVSAAATAKYFRLGG